MQVQVKFLSGEILTVDVLPIGNREINGLAVLLSVAEHLQISYFLLSLFNDREEIEPDDKVSDGDIFYAFIRDADEHVYNEQWEEEQDLPQELE
jgi:hypothetical protein